MNRREFLGQAALAAASLSACSSLNARTTPDSPVARARTPKKVIVIGAGLAGLVAGYELTQAGHEVAILEARARPGGRVHTRCPCATRRAAMRATPASSRGGQRWCMIL